VIFLPMNNFKRKNGFISKEFLLFAAIAAILAVAIIFLLWTDSVQRRAAVASYKTSMNSVKAAIELCTGANETALSGIPGQATCNNNNGLNYPNLSFKCESGTPYFGVTETENSWSVAAYTDTSLSSPWTCKGCWIWCNASTCTNTETIPGENNCR